MPFVTILLLNPGLIPSNALKPAHHLYELQRFEIAQEVYSANRSYDMPMTVHIFQF